MTYPTSANPELRHIRRRMRIKGAIKELRECSARGTKSS